MLTSPGCTGNSASEQFRFDAMLPCVSITPLGVPVVPEV